MQKIIITVAVILLFGLGFMIFSFFQNSGLMEYETEYREESTDLPIADSI